MRTQPNRATGIALVLIVAGIAATANADPPDDRIPVEPGAGQWTTWVISSGKDCRVPPPPGAAATRAELRTMANLIRQNDAQVQQQITFWDAGAPAYRWMDLINQRALDGKPLTAFSHRVYTYVA